MKDRFAVLKWLVFAALVTCSIVLVTPVREKLRLGLDLAGGTSFTVQIDESQLREDIKSENEGIADAEVQRRVDEIMKDADDRTIEVIRNRIDGLGVNEPVIVAGKDHRIIVEIPGADEEQRAIAEKSIRSAAYLQFKLLHQKNYELVQKVLSGDKTPEGYERRTYDGRDYFVRSADYERVIRDPEYKRRLARFGNPDPNYSFMLELNRLKDGTEAYLPAFVRTREEMNGNELSKADISYDSRNGQVSVSLAFSKKGAREFARVTSNYCPRGDRNRSDEGRQLGIVLDGTLYSAPVIRTAIRDGRAEISGNFSRDDAAQLRNVLNAGSLPAPIKILEKRTIDPSLGKDSIHSGMVASLIGGLLVIAFMVGYYLFFGIVADIGLALNLVLLPLGMIVISGFFGAVGAVDSAAASRGALQLPVLTMPGIAGIVLTIGMAVDANVLIFERIREELKQGKSALAAVAAGYDRAFLAIFDSNLTTFLTAIILFVFGSGPIRGFAVTLSAGIIVSMYTALVVTRMILAAVLAKNIVPAKLLNVKDMFKIPNFDFLANGRKALVASGIVIAVTIAIFAMRCVVNPRGVMAVDFTGGTVMTFAFEKAPSVSDIRAELVKGGVTDAVVTTQKSIDGSSETVSVKSGFEEVNGKNVNSEISSILDASFADNGVRHISEDTIGSQIGDDLKRDATKAVIFALVGILLYISLRFEFGFALGAVAALLHDVLITLGLFTLFGRQIGVTAIACFLTIVGYSVNDTIVIFDRIREDVKKNPDMNFKELCNRSIHVTLGRTVITSLTTLLAVFSLLVFGGGAIFDFALAMTIGIIAGIYSTVFIATPIMLAWYKGRRPEMASQVRK